MKKLIFLGAIVFVTVHSVFAQQQKEQKSPDEQIIVNRNYDEQGNLIEYDSTYFHKWTTDSTFYLGIPGDKTLKNWNFPGIEQFMNEFWNDSLFRNRPYTPRPFSFGFEFSPFGEDSDRLNPRLFSDSLFQRNFPYRLDSLFFKFGTTPFPDKQPDIDHKFFENFGERLKEHFYRYRDEDFAFPEFKNFQHQQEYEQLLEKHRKELEELKKKWDEQKPKNK